MYKRLGLTAFAAFALTAAMAAQADTQPGFYAGVGIGSSNLEFDEDELGIDFDGDDVGFKIFGGYSFNPYFAVEGAYIDGGAPSETFFGTELEFEISGFIGSAVGRLPVSDNFSLFAKLGFASYDVEFSATGFGSVSDSESDMAYGVGAELSFAERWGARVEYEALDLSVGDFNMISVSGMYRF